MSRILTCSVLAFLLTAASGGSLMFAAEAGQDDLDKAVQARLNAETTADLGEVVTLLESALEKGLDADSAKLAKRILASTLVQRGTAAAAAVSKASPPNATWTKYRQNALADLEKAVNLDPKQSQALLLIAQLNLLPDGDQKRAREALNEAIKIEEEDPTTRVKALILRASLPGEAAKRLADLDEAVRLAPDDAAAVHARALFQADTDKLDAALVDLGKAIELEPDDTRLYEEKAIVLARLKRFDESLAALDKARQISPESIGLLVQRAHVHSAQENTEGAMQDLNQALEIDPNNIAVLLLRAGLYQGKGEIEKALADVDRALELKPNLPIALRTRALILAQNEQFAEATEVLEKLHEAEPKDLLTIVQLSLLYNAQKQYDKAIKNFDLWLAEKPDDWQALCGRGDAYLSIGKQAEAFADYEKAAEQLENLHEADPKDLPTIIQLSTLYSAQKQYGKAIKSFDLWLTEKPDDWQALRGRGDAYLNIGKQAEAIADYEKVIKIEPKDSGVLNNFAWVLATSPDEKLRDGKRALQLATEACELTEYKLAYILSTLAAAYAENGDLPKAIEWSTKAVELDNNEHGDALKKELESYKAGKPWRELLDEETAVEKPKEAPAEKSDAKPVK